MKYIVHKRFKDKAICGMVNLPALTECTLYEGTIYYKEYPICFVTSENSHQHFAMNEDGQGLLRGKLTQAIQKTLAKRDDKYQERWDKVWDDEICLKYKRTEYDDYFLWNHEFFEASIKDLQYIANLVGAKVKD